MRLSTIEFDKWAMSDEGKRCLNGEAKGVYLANRIRLSWDAAWDASRANNHLVVGALDTLGTALSEHGHTWTEGQREIYEQAIQIVKGHAEPPASSSPNKGVA